ncbi:MAG: cytochrome b/b6 domain-containing protein [Bacteroidota bacterium]|nr:cytochrome b/b6 domain-containing protein [Bacteroidota bacterium]
MEEKVYLYPVWIRLWHLLNALLCLMLILTGLSMQYSEPGTGLIRFDIAVTIHNVCGVILTISYFVFIFGNLFTKNGRHYRLEPIGLFKRLWIQARYYAYGFFKKENPPFPIGLEQKFNPLQKVSYAFIMYLFVPIILLTGWGMLYPETIIANYLGINGYQATDLLHIASGFVMSVFLIIHLYFATMGAKPLSHYKGMITGYHVHEDH